MQIGKSAIHRNHDVVEELDLRKKLGCSVKSTLYILSFDKLDENHDVDLVIYTCIESIQNLQDQNHPIRWTQSYLIKNNSQK